MHTAVFSIISPNYRHFVRVLMASVERNHPEWDRFVLIVGETAATHDDRFTTVPLEALNLPNERQFCFRYTLLELNTATKPWMFEYLFGRGYDRVVYLDPDIYIYNPLLELDPKAFITLTPHLTGSIGGDLHPSERTILQAGTHNLGFLAVSRHGALARFLAWWKEKLEFQCVVDVANGLFVDQKWMDLAPSLFPDVAILRHDGYNVAYWNLRQRKVIGESAGATVNGQPIRFFHFSGINPAIPTLVSNKDTRMKVTDVGDAAKLVKEYRAALFEAGYESSRKAPYAFGVFVDGSPIPDLARALYRDSARLQSAGGSDPFAHPELFVGLRDVSKPPLMARIGVKSYRALSRVRTLVPLIPRPWRTALRNLLLQRRESRTSGVATQSSLRPGLNVVGYFGRETGVAESARLCRQACERVELPGHLIDIDRDGLTRQAVHRATIYHVNADQTPAVHDKLRKVFDSSLYNIGCWHWELPELPDAWIPSADPLDEIWAPSSFIQSAISSKVTIPVVHMPHGIEVTSIEACSPEELGVPPDRFTFLSMFDFASVVERKNPMAAVEAFRRAFPDRSSPAALLIKTINAATHPGDYSELEERLRGSQNVYLCDRTLSRARVSGLLSSCDAALSMHRSEGFGLILAESMYLGKPVVATGWSGNMDFMNSRNSCPVDYEIVTIDQTHDAYRAGGQWAEPDVDHAVHLMRRLFDDQAYRAEVGRRARDTIHSRFSPEAAGLRYRRRLELLGLMEERVRGQV